MKSYMTGQQVMARYQISEMTLYRWVNDPKMGFPQPMIVNHRRFFSEVELTEWERRNAKGKSSAPANPREKKEAPFHDVSSDILAVLRKARSFINEEADNRGDAGSEYSDYEREPRELVKEIDAVIRAAKGRANG